LKPIVDLILSLINELAGYDQRINHDASRKFAHHRQTARACISQFSQIVKWKNPAIPVIASHLPPLVPIRNAQLQELSLTHKSWAVQHSHTALKTSVEGGCNKGLELLGDGVLGLYAVEVLGRRYPGLSHTALAVSSRRPQQHAGRQLTPTCVSPR
jgi:dsRNA-specific ribonuclease